MKEIILQNGFKVELEEDTLNDAEILEALVDMEDKPQNAIKILTMFLGKKQKEALYDHIRDENGRVKASDAFNCLTEILKASGDDVKN